MGAEVFDDVAFYYVACALLVTVLVPLTLYLVYRDVSELLHTPTVSKNGSEGFLNMNKTIKTRSFKEKYLNWKGLLLVAAWGLLVYLLLLLPTMQTMGFATFEPYSILGVDLDASNATIRKAYRKLSLVYHPDKNTENKEEAAQKFQLVAKAYAALTDPRVKANMQKYGNPDGFKGFSMTYALPTFLASKDNEVYVLLGYLFLFLIIPSVIFLVWYKKSSQYHDSGVHHESLAYFLRIATEELNPVEMWEHVATAAEFSKMYPIDSRIKEVNRLMQLLNRKLVPITNEKLFPVLYTNVLLGAYRTGVPVEGEGTKKDLEFILSKSHALFRIFFEIGKANRFFNLVIGAITNMQILTQGSSNGRFLEQLPNIEEEESKLLEPLNIKSIDRFIIHDKEVIKSTLKWSEEKYNETYAAALCFPSLFSQTRVHVPGAEEITTNDILQFDITMHRRNVQEIVENEKENDLVEKMTEDQKKEHAKKKQEAIAAKNKLVTEKLKKEFSVDTSIVRKKDMTPEEKEDYERKVQNAVSNFDVVDHDAILMKQQDAQLAPYVISKRFPIPRRETWYVILCILKPNGDQIIIDSKTVTSFDKDYLVRFVMKAPVNEGVYAYQVYIMSDSYLDTNVFHRIFTKIYEPATVQNLKKEKLLEQRMASLKNEKKDEIKDGKKKDSKKSGDNKKSTSTGSALLDAMAAEADAAVVEDEDEDDEEVIKARLLEGIEKELAEEDDDEEDEEVEEEQVEEEGKWYYLGAASFMEMVINIVVLSILGFFVFNWLESKGYWQKYFMPPINTFILRISPHLKKAYKVIEPSVGPIIKQILLGWDWLIHWQKLIIVSETPNVDLEF